MPWKTIHDILTTTLANLSCLFHSYPDIPSRTAKNGNAKRTIWCIPFTRKIEGKRRIQVWANEKDCVTILPHVFNFIDNDFSCLQSCFPLSWIQFLRCLEKLVKLGDLVWRERVVPFYTGQNYCMLTRPSTKAIYERQNHGPWSAIMQCGRSSMMQGSFSRDPFWVSGNKDRMSYVHSTILQKRK